MKKIDDMTEKELDEFMLRKKIELENDPWMIEFREFRACFMDIVSYYLDSKMQLFRLLIEDALTNLRNITNRSQRKILKEILYELEHICCFAQTIKGRTREHIKYKTRYCGCFDILYTQKEDKIKMLPQLYRIYSDFIKDYKEYLSPIRIREIFLEDIVEDLMKYFIREKRKNDTLIYELQNQDIDC
jgi:hypothetical protein